MSASCTAIRLITLLFLIAGILLLRKPVFGQTNLTAPQIRATALGAKLALNITSPRKSRTHRISISKKRKNPAVRV